MDQFLICHRGALGDFILTWPALYTLKRSLPDLRFIGVGRTEYMRLAIRLGLLDSCCSAESSEMVGFFSGQCIPSMPGMPGFSKGAIQGAILWLAEGQAVAELLKKSGASLPVALIPPFPRKRMHVGLYQWLAVQSWFPSHFPIEAPDPPIPASPIPDSQIPDSCSPCFSLGSRRGEYALIHPGSGSTAKNYHPQVYCDLADELRHRGYSEVRFVLGPAEAQDKIIAQYLAGERVEAPEDVEALARLQAGASIYLGNDSGASHLAGVLGTPTIALYKVTDPEVWGVMGCRVTNLKALNGDSALQQVRECLDGIGKRRF